MRDRGQNSKKSAISEEKRDLLQNPKNIYKRVAATQYWK